MNFPIINGTEKCEKTLELIYSQLCNDLSDVNLEDCKIYRRADDIVIEHNDRVYYSENATGNYCYIQEALDNMDPDKPAKWKTLRRLIVFRYAIRENMEQEMGLEDMYNEGMDLRHYLDFVALARRKNAMHHKQETF